MKKRILALLLLAAMSFTLLAACGKDSGDEPSDIPEQDPAFSVDLAEFYDKMMAAAQEAPMMMPMEGEMLDTSYEGLSALDLKQCVINTAAISAVAMEFAFVEAADAAGAETVKNIFQARIDAQVDGGAWYPATIEQWEKNSEIVTVDNYVCLFVAADKDVLIEAFRSGSDVPAWAIPENTGDGEEDMDVDLPAEITAEPSPEPSEAPSASPVPSPKPTPTPTPKPSPTPTPTPEPTPASVDLAAFYATLFTDPANTPAVMDMTEIPEAMEAYYSGLSDIETKQCLIYTPMITAVAFEIALIEVANTSDVNTVKAILQTRIDNEINNNFNYPSVTENWENNSRIVSNGNYIMMVAYKDCDSFVGQFNALF